MRCGARGGEPHYGDNGGWAASRERCIEETARPQMWTCLDPEAEMPVQVQRGEEWLRRRAYLVSVAKVRGLALFFSNRRSRRILSGPA